MIDRNIVAAALAAARLTVAQASDHLGIAERTFFARLDGSRPHPEFERDLQRLLGSRGVWLYSPCLGMRNIVVVDLDSDVVRRRVASHFRECLESHMDPATIAADMTMTVDDVVAYNRGEPISEGARASLTRWFALQG